MGRIYMNKIKMHATRLSQSKQVRFGAVGIVNTLVDFGLFNILILLVELPILVANILATTTAMLVSFILNRNGVFRSKGSSRIEIVLFFATTLTGLWIIQNGVILTLYPLLGTLPIPIKLNIIKAIAIIIGLVWNYVWYSRVVFNDKRNMIIPRLLRYLDKHWSLVVILTIGISIIIGLIMGYGRSIWFDEGYSIMVAQRPIDQIIALTQVDAHPPLYYLYLKVWGSIFSWSEFSLRLSSIIPGALSIGVMAMIVRRLFDSKVAIATLPFLLLAPFIARYNYEIRMYSLVLFIGTFATYVLVRAKESKNKKWWLTYGALVALGMYTLYMSVVIWLGHAIWLIYNDISHKRTPLRQKHWLYYVGAVVLFIPWVPTVIHQLQNSALPPYMTQLDVTAFVNVLVLVMSYTPIWNGDIISLAGTIVFVPFFAWVLIRVRKGADIKMRRKITFFIIMILSALVFYWLSSVPPNPPRFTDRYMLHVSVFFYALVGLTVALAYRFKLRRQAIALAVVALGLFGYGLSSLYTLGNYNLQRLQPTYSKIVRSDIGCDSDTTIMTSGAYGYIDMWYAFQDCDFRYYQPAELTYIGGYAPMNALNTSKRVKQISDVSAQRIAFIYYDDSTEFPSSYDGYELDKTLNYNGVHVEIYQSIR
jgi:mannosyltransferase